MLDTPKPPALWLGVEGLVLAALFGGANRFRRFGDFLFRRQGVTKVSVERFNLGSLVVEVGVQQSIGHDHSDADALESVGEGTDALNARLSHTLYLLKC